MISLISPALIMPCPLKRRRVLGSGRRWPVCGARGSAGPFSSAVFSHLHRRAWRPAHALAVLPSISSADQALAHALELALEASVHHVAPALRDEPAQERPIDRLLEDDLGPPQRPLQAGGQHPAFLLRQRHRRPHPDAHPPLVAVHELAAGGADGGALVGAALGR